MTRKRKWKRVVGSLILLILLVGLAAGCWFVDRMAVSYLTGQRRVVGKDWFGNAVRMDGPSPGYLFLGFSRPAEDSTGFEIVRPADEGSKAGLKAGDVVLSVDGKTYQSSFDLVSVLLEEHNAGDSVQVEVQRGDQVRLLEMGLQAFLRTPSDLGLAYEEVEFTSRSGAILRGWFLPPPPGSDGRAGIFVHGANASRFQALDGARYWHNRGYGLLAMDLSGRGTSEGEYVTYSENERWDVVSMVEWLRKKPGVAGDGVVVFGTSNGGASAIYAAATDPDFPPMVLDAPYSDLWAEAGEMLSGRGLPAELLNLLRWPVLWRAGVDLKAVRPVEVIDKVRGPVFFIHGDADTQVLPYHSDRMHQLRLQAGLPSRRLVIPGGEHGFDNYPPPEEFWGSVLDYFDSCLKQSGRLSTRAFSDVPR